MTFKFWLYRFCFDILIYRIEAVVDYRKISSNCLQRSCLVSAMKLFNISLPVSLNMLML